MQPFSPHNRFFSSLNQVEQRLSSEQRNTNKKQRHDQQPNTHPSPLFSSSPLFLSDHQPPPNTGGGGSSSSSGPPPDFLSDTPLTVNQQEQDLEEPDDADDIAALMDLLGLSVSSSSYSLPSSCDCSESGFYKNVVGLKGPKCEKEMRRLDGWIEAYRRERKEPARLAHLMIAKAAAMNDCGDGRLEFPATVEEFLERDPPV